MHVPKWLAALVAAVLIALSVGATLLFTDRIPVHETLPAGCTRAEVQLPGCHPTATRVSANTVAALAVVVSPLATLLVALVAVSASKSRQTEQLDAERDRLDRELAHDRVMKDRQEIRQILDSVTSSVDRYRDLLNQGVDHGELDDPKLVDRLDHIETDGNRLLVRLGFTHPIFHAYSDVLAQMERRSELADTLIAASADTDDERWAATVKTSMESFRTLIDASLPYVRADLPEN